MLLLLLLLLLVAPSHLTLAPSGELREIGQSLAGPCHQAQGLRLCPTVRPSLPYFIRILANLRPPTGFSDMSIRAHLTW